MGGREMAVLAGVLFAALAGATGCNGDRAESSDEQVAQGLIEFRRNCAICHGPNGEGMPRLGKRLTQNEFVRGQSDGELLEFLRKGRPANHPLNERGITMPPMGGNPAVTEPQLESIVAYLRSIE